MYRNRFVSSLASSLTVAILAVSHAAASPAATSTPSSLRNLDEGTVEAEGRGATVVDAKKDAIVNGLRKIVGEYVRSDTVIENDEVVEDVIRTFTTGQQVRSEQIGEVESTDDGQFVVRMRVTTDPRSLEREYEAAAASAFFVDGENLAAELEFAADNIASQAKVLERLTRDMSVRLLVNRLIDENGRPLNGVAFPRTDVKRMPDGSAVIALNVQSYFDLKGWYEKVGPNLRSALSAMAISSADSALAFNLADASFPESRTDVASPTARLANYPMYEKSTFKDGVIPWSTFDFGGIEKIASGDMVILVSRSRDKFGKSETFDAYHVPEVIFPEHLAHLGGVQSERSQEPPAWKWMSVPSRIKVIVSLVDESGATLASEDMPIGGDIWFCKSARSKYTGELRLDELSLHPMGGFAGVTSQEDWPVPSVEPFKTVILTPRFFDRMWTNSNVILLENKLRVTDVVASRLEIAVAPGLLERVAGVVFSAYVDAPGASGRRYESIEPMKPGGRFKMTASGNRTARKGGSSSGSSTGGKSTKSGGPGKTGADAFKSNFAMLNNYAGIGKGREAAEYARRILDEGGDSLTAGNLWACGDALRPCVGDYDADLMRAELFNLVISRFPDSREAALAKLELGE